MIGELLLEIMISDLREMSEEELRAKLKRLAGGLSGAAPALERRISRQLKSTVLDLEEIETFPDDYPELLPESMQGYKTARDRFEALVEDFFTDDAVHDNEKFERFRSCIERLTETTEPADLAEASLGIELLKKELVLAREQYVARPLDPADCTPSSVLAHRNLLEGFDIWLNAFEMAHRNEYHEALETALEGACIFFAVDRWANTEFAPGDEE